MLFQSLITNIVVFIVQYFKSYYKLTVLVPYWQVLTPDVDPLH